MTTYIVIGVVLASLYALIAMSLVFVYEATGVVNFAFGALGMVAAYGFDTLSGSYTPWLAFLVVVATSTVVGALLGWFSVPIRRADHEVKATTSLALVVAAQGLVVLIWGTDARSPTPLVGGTAFSLDGVPITWQRLIAVGFAVVGCATISLFLSRTRTGSAVRAVASDEITARLIGLSVTRLWILAWAMSTALAAGAVIVMLPDVGMSTGQLTFIVLVPLAAVAIADFRRPLHAVAAATVLGLATGLMSGVDSLVVYRDAVPLAAVAAALVVRGGRPAARTI